MLRLTDIALFRGPRCLFSGVDLALHTGQRVGITGRNGTGKSSLLALIRGELHADKGECTLATDTRIAHVAQETPALARAAIDYVIDGDHALRRTEAALAEAECGGEGERLARLHAEYEHRGGYTARARAGRLLHGLGFADDELDRPVSDFSGGWRMRLNLARALMTPSDLLLLDEPTNHLDLEAVLWLERWLAGYPGLLLLISHDRDFLDRAVSHVAHIENQGIRLYAGDYSRFERQRAEQLRQQQATHDRQQREIAHVRRFADRFRAKATKARQVQSRLKALERMAAIEAAHADNPFDFVFRPPARLPSPLLRLEEAAAGYDPDRPVLVDLNLSLEPGARIGLLGYNGAGKSTLIKLLAATLEPFSGQRTASRHLDTGYFAQHQLEQLDPEASALLALQRIAGNATEQTLRDYLGGFDFRGDRVAQPCGDFSGGEKARLVLALIVWQAPNLLLLDEPTNHLDLEMRQALTRALQAFPGAVVLVSHDRHLLRTTVDQFLLVDNGAVQPFDGDLDDYRRWLDQQERTDDDHQENPPAAHSATARKAQRQEAAKVRERRKPLMREIHTLEEEIEQLDASRAAVEKELADPAFYNDAPADTVQARLREQGRLVQAIETAEARWMALHEALERLDPDGEWPASSAGG